MSMTTEERNAQGVLARQELAELFESMKPAEQRGVQLFLDLVRKHLNVGYKQVLSPKYKGALSTIPTLKKE